MCPSHLFYRICCFVAPTGIELVFVKKQGVRGMCPSHLFYRICCFVAPTGIEPVFHA